MDFERVADVLWDLEGVVVILSVEVRLKPVVSSSQLIVTVASMNFLDLLTITETWTTNDDICVTDEVFIKRISSILVVSIEVLVSLVPCVCQLLVVEVGPYVVSTSAAIEVRVTSVPISSDEIVVPYSASD